MGVIFDEVSATVETQPDPVANDSSTEEEKKSPPDPLRQFQQMLECHKRRMKRICAD